MKSPNERAIQRVVIATGLASIVTQLLTIREYLSRFQGNEIVIALILFSWLVIGGTGTLLAHALSRRWFSPSIPRLAGLSLLLPVLSVFQIILIRKFHGLYMIHGVSVGFYETFAYIFFGIAPYALLIGFVLPYSLFLIRCDIPDYSGTRIYITDNIGDVAGGILFSFFLIFFFTPLRALFLAHLPLIITSLFLFPPSRRRHPAILISVAVVVLTLLWGSIYEKASLKPLTGSLVDYRDSPYGRIAVVQDEDQYTLFADGRPLYSNQNIVAAEEAIHYPLVQLSSPENILLVSARGEMMKEVEKYHIKSVDLVELDPEMTRMQFKYGLIKKIPGLRVIHHDGRAFLSETSKTYDAVLIHLPEPETYQTNRFFTLQFFEIVKHHLKPNGVISFAMEGYENYLAENQRKKLSSLYHTLTVLFKNVVLLPGQNVYFICSDAPIDNDIPHLLAERKIFTRYLKDYFHGNLTQDRIAELNRLMETPVPQNSDLQPFLMRTVFSQWFTKHADSPTPFVIFTAALLCIYLFWISKEEFVLFSTGFLSMGSEILIIFAFQIFFGYIYFQIGSIITAFLAGLLPGAWLGSYLRQYSHKILIAGDILLVLMLVVFFFAIQQIAILLPISFFIVFGFMLSLICGFQFPAALSLKGSHPSAITRIFSSDLVGAAFGTLLVSTLLLPFLGFSGCIMGLIGLKIASLVIIGFRYVKH